MNEDDPLRYSFTPEQFKKFQAILDRLERGEPVEIFAWE